MTSRLLKLGCFLTRFLQLQYSASHHSKARLLFPPKDRLVRQQGKGKGKTSLHQMATLKG